MSYSIGNNELAVPIRICEGKFTNNCNAAVIGYYSVLVCDEKSFGVFFNDTVCSVIVVRIIEGYRQLDVSVEGSGIKF